MSDPYWKGMFPDYAEGLADGGGGGGGDVTPPVGGATPPVSVVYAEVATSPVVITVVDADSAIGFVAIAVKFASSDVAEAILLGVTSDPVTSNGYQAPYARLSTTTGGGGAGVGYTFNVVRDGGWPADDVASFIVKATDSAGNILV